MVQWSLVGTNIELAPSTRHIDALYRRHATRVRWVARARGISESALDDVVHDVFLRVFRTLHERDDAVPITQWLAGITRNVAFSHRRSTARRRNREAQSEAPNQRRSPEDELVQKQAFGALREFLGTLDDGQREAFIMCELLQTPAPQVAKEAGIKVNTVYSRLRLARRRFESNFEQHAQALLLATKDPQDRASHRRAVALLAADLGVKSSSALAASTGTLAGWKVAAAALTIVVATGAAGAVAINDEPPTPPPASVAAAPSPASVAAVAPSAPAISPVPTVSALAPPDTPAKAHALPPLRTQAPTQTQTPQTPRTVPGSVVPVLRPDPLAVEVELLRVARSQLATDPTAALRTVNEHARRFPEGSLVKQRRGIEREAACASGDQARAQRTAKALGTDESSACPTGKTKTP